MSFILTRAMKDKATKLAKKYDLTMGQLRDMLHQKKIKLSEYEYIAGLRLDKAQELAAKVDAEEIDDADLERMVKKGKINEEIFKYAFSDRTNFTRLDTGNPYNYSSTPNYYDDRNQYDDDGEQNNARIVGHRKRAYYIAAMVAFVAVLIMGAIFGLYYRTGSSSTDVALPFSEKVNKSIHKRAEDIMAALESSSIKRVHVPVLETDKHKQAKPINNKTISILGLDLQNIQGSTVPSSRRVSKTNNWSQTSKPWQALLTEASDSLLPTDKTSYAIRNYKTHVPVNYFYQLLDLTTTTTTSPKDQEKQWMKKKQWMNPKKKIPPNVTSASSTMLGMDNHRHGHNDHGIINYHLNLTQKGRQALISKNLTTRLEEQTIFKTNATLISEVWPLFKDLLLYDKANIPVTIRNKEDRNSTIMPNPQPTRLTTKYENYIDKFFKAKGRAPTTMTVLPVRAATFATYAYVSLALAAALVNKLLAKTREVSPVEVLAEARAVVEHAADNAATVSDAIESLATVVIVQNKWPEMHAIVEDLRFMWDLVRLVHHPKYQWDRLVYQGEKALNLILENLKRDTKKSLERKRSMLRALKILVAARDFVHDAHALSRHEQREAIKREFSEKLGPLVRRLYESIHQKEEFRDVTVVIEPWVLGNYDMNTKANMNTKATPGRHHDLYAPMLETAVVVPRRTESGPNVSAPNDVHLTISSGEKTIHEELVLSQIMKRLVQITAVISHHQDRDSWMTAIATARDALSYILRHRNTIKSKRWLMAGTQIASLRNDLARHLQDTHTSAKHAMFADLHEEFVRTINPLVIRLYCLCDNYFDQVRIYNEFRWLEEDPRIPKPSQHNSIPVKCTDPGLLANIGPEQFMDTFSKL
jgi:hypothetical protein